MTLSEEIYCKIKDDINNLTFKANEFLNEQQLAQQYDVSKAPIRAALHKLCMENILVSYPRKGYLILTLNDSEFQQAQDMRVLNEGYALELLCDYASKEDLMQIKQIAEAGNSVQDNMNFHLSLAKFSGNRFLYETIDHLLCAVTRTLSVYLFDNRENDFQESHIAIIDALIDRDLESAKELLSKDIRR